MKYNTGNYNKYMTANPLKRAMVRKLNRKIISVVGQLLTDGKREYRLLDAGCGEGFISGLIHENFTNVSVTGLERSGEALKIACNRNKNIRFQQGNIYHMPFSDASFDIVICTEVLEHLENPYAALKEIDRVAGGAVLLSVPAEPWFCLGNLMVLKNVKKLGNPMDHINHWTYPGFIKFVRTFLKNRRKAFGGGYLRAWISFPWSVVVYRKNEKRGMEKGL